MNALINITEEAGCSLQDILKDKIEKSIINDKLVCIIISSQFVECRNTFYIADYEVDEDCIYINADNFELHIMQNDIMEMNYNDCDEQFVITGKHNKVNILF